MMIDISNSVELRDLVILTATLSAILPTISWLVFCVKDMMKRVLKIEVSQARIETKLDMLINNSKEK